MLHFCISGTDRRIVLSSLKGITEHLKLLLEMFLSSLRGPPEEWLIRYTKRLTAVSLIAMVMITHLLLWPFIVYEVVQFLITHPITVDPL